MQQGEYEKLLEAAAGRKNTSIAVNADGAPVHGRSVPWETEASARSMMLPRIALTEDDLHNNSILQLLHRCSVLGCYIDAPLSSYDFLAGFPELLDLSVLHGGAIRDLSFVRHMKELRLFYLEDAALPDLKPLIACGNEGWSINCLGFCRCRVEDTSALLDVHFPLDELLVWPVEGDMRRRWVPRRDAHIKPPIFRFYDDPGYDKSTSRFLALILRHRPQTIGITLDEHGWANVDELIAGVSKTRPLDRETLEKIVRLDEKQRYSFNEDKTMIRANQGHSIPVDVEPGERRPPKILYHGTAEKYVSSIVEQGLIPKSRLYVHLSRDYETAFRVGSRHGKPLVFQVSAEQMADDGYAFFLSANGVWLTKYVPAKYLRRDSSGGNQ